MRNILFRAKEKVTNRWVYGSYVKGYTQSVIIEEKNDIYSVYDDTVGQDTDFISGGQIYGEHIFEGDILENIEDSSVRGVVEYYNGTFVLNIDGYKTPLSCVYEFCKIVGNIYDCQYVYYTDENKRKNIMTLDEVKQILVERDGMKND